MARMSTRGISVVCEKPSLKILDTVYSSQPSPDQPYGLGLIHHNVNTSHRNLHVIYYKIYIIYHNDSAQMNMQNRT